VTQGEDGPRLGGDGPVIDHAVQMRRFDETQLLDNIAARGGLDNHLLRALAGELARLHGELPTCNPAPEGEEPGTPRALRAAIEENFRQVRAYPLAEADLRRLDAVETWSRQRFDTLAPLLRQRVVEGRVIDGHGDAHLGNIALVDGAVRLFDCIEFNPGFRIMDSIAEAAFLTMDLEARGYRGESRRLLTDYLEYRGDYEGLAVLDLYRSYYAMVRAKVNLLREPPDRANLAGTDAVQACRRYLALAHHYCQEGEPFFAITHGVSGTGKSTIAGNLVAASGAVRIRSDVERKRLFGLAPEQRSRPEDTTALYSSEMSRRTFDRLAALAGSIVAAGFPVIVDATFLHRPVRDRFRALAGDLGVPFIIIDCIAGAELLRERLLERERQGRDASEAGVAVMEKQLETDEPIAGDELRHRLPSGSGEDGDALLARCRALCQTLRSA
jgi:aminoglycoside phosphotransferase family enzyme/predicted kinase